VGGTGDPDRALAALIASLPAHTLVPPEPGSCRVRAWQAGRSVAPEVECDAAGRYTLEVDSGVEGAIDVELRVTGHLRGLVRVQLPVADGDGGGDGGGEGGGDGEPDRGAEVGVPTVALGPGHTLAGQTLDARGQPLAKVRVQAMPQPGLGEVEPWRTQSDENGRFSFTTLPYGPVSLRAIHDGYALSVVEAIAPEDDVLMVLDALIDLEGSVVGHEELWARARARLEGSSVWPAIEGRLGADGRFVFESLPDGVYGVEVSVLAQTPGEPEFASVPLENVTPDLRVNLALVPAFRVPVRVVDPEGTPLHHARVTLGYGQLGMLQKVAETDEEGRARVGPVVPGPYVLHADADGFLPPPALEIEVGSEGFEPDEQVLVLVRPAKLQGVVVDEDDRPVAGAEVSVESEVAFSVGEGDTRARMFAAAMGAGEGSLGVTAGAVPDIPLFDDDEDESGVGVVLSDAEGRFEIDLLLPGTYRLRALHGGHAGSAVEVFELRSGELREGVTLKLREGVPLTGVVRGSNGEPIAAVQVDLGDGTVLTSDRRGVFDAGFRRGSQRLVFRAAGMVPRVVEIDMPRVGRPAVDVAVTLAPAQGRVQGRVVDGNGQPIRDVEVELRPLDGLSPSLVTWTDAKGSYDFDALSPGEVALYFAHAAYVPDLDEVEVDEPHRSISAHEWVLHKGWEAEILVRASKGGAGIEGAALCAGRARARTDSRGVARLEHLVGSLELEVDAPGWMGVTLTIDDDGSGRVELTIELAEGGGIEGTIDDDIGDSVASAKISVTTTSGQPLGEATSDARGRWRVEGVPPGDVLVRAEPPAAYEAVLAPVEVESDVLRGEVTKAVRLRFERR